ncbi:MAG: GNAT family N-acetyltransferase [Phaeodactylibacter sp.]|nr:GNAT family N-acetyltransferase [Phaeodactylibacter sp.]
MSHSFSCTVERRIPTVEEYQTLRNSTGWDELADAAVEKGLSNSIFCACAIHQGAIIGMGRLVGDNAVYFYVQDVIVLPEFQGRGVGKAIMQEIERYLEKNAPRNAFIGLMAAAGIKKFYRQFGYVERGEDRPGMYKIQNATKGPRSNLYNQS